MPFGGALAVGLIGTGANVANGAMGSKAAKKAAGQLNDAGIWSANKVLDTASSVNKDIGAALDPAVAAVTGAAGAAGTGVTGAANTAAGGVNAGTLSANGTLADVLKQQSGALSPYLQMGSTAADAYTRAMGPNGPLSSTFSYNPNDVQNNLAYQFTLDQGKKAIQAAASASGNSQGGATAKALARYAAGAATQGINDDYNRALSTFNANRNATLQSLGFGVSAGQNATNTLTGALSNYGNQVGQNTLYNAVYGGNAAIDAAKYGGNAGLEAGMFTGNSTLQTALAQAQNYMNAANAAAGYRMQGAGAQAAGTMAGANAWGNALSGTANLATTLYGMKQQNGSSSSPFWNAGPMMTPDQMGWSPATYPGMG